MTSLITDDIDWATSDWHLDHENIIGFCNRPFDSVTDMNEALVRAWNSVVEHTQRVLILGDLCMGHLEHSLGYLRRLMGYKILIPGNHDRCWCGSHKGGHGGYQSWEQAYLDAGIDEIIQTGAGFGEPTLELAGQTVKLSHFPYLGDSHEQREGDKYTAWRPDDEGGWLLHGHVHNTPGNQPRQARSINVGVDVWDYQMVNMKWIEAIIREHHD